MNNRSAPVRWWLPIVAIAMAWALALVAGCAFSRAPLVDERPLNGIYIANSVLVGLVTGFRSSYPNEAAFCLQGEVRDTVTDNGTQHIAVVNDFFQAAADSADGENVYFPKNLPGGCAGGGLIGLAHDEAEFGPCVHSLNDANVLYDNKQALFSLLLCADGRMQVLYRDGRRVMDRWIPN